MRPTALLLPLLLLPCACKSLTTEDEARLRDHKQQAKYYFESGKWSQAMGQIDRGLELAPDDYTLNAMKGGILLLASIRGDRTDLARLDEATTLLATLYEQRSLSRHEPFFLLDYARALQRHGLRHAGEALRLEDQATRTKIAGEGEELREQAAAERAQAAEFLQRADELLAELVDRGEYLRIAQNHRLQIALQRGDDAAFLAHSKEFFEQSRKAQELTKKRIDDTSNVDYEREQIGVLRELVAEEADVRALAAEFCYARRNFTTALEHLNRVLEADPRRFVDYYNRGKVQLELGNREAANEDFRRFLADPALLATSDKALFAMKAIGK
jgi:hypothetical protein